MECYFKITPSQTRCFTKLLQISVLLLLPDKKNCLGQIIPHEIQWAFLKSIRAGFPTSIINTQLWVQIPIQLHETIYALIVMFPLSPHQIWMLHMSHSSAKYLQLEILSFQMPEIPQGTPQKESGWHWHCGSRGLIPLKNLEVAKVEHRAAKNWQRMAFHIH